jgi:zinc protease
MHSDFEKLLIFNEILSTNSMDSRLFKLREQAGYFYTISGSTTVGAAEYPGKMAIQTLVSCENLNKAEQLIKKTMYEMADTITEQEFEIAKRKLIHSLVEHFSTNFDIATTFLFLVRYALPHDYFDSRAQEVNNITLDDMKSTVKKIMNAEKLVTIKVGRV